MLGGFVLFVAVVTSVAAALGSARAKDRPSVSEEQRAAAANLADRDFLLTIDDLGQHMPGFEKQEGVEKIERDGFLGSTEVSYEYDPPGDEGIFLSSSITVDRSAREARDSFTGMKLGMGLMFSAEKDVDTEERNDLLKWGDESRALVLTAGGQPVGNVFLARKGRRVFFLTIAGVYFDDPEAFGELIVPKLEKMELFEP